MRTLAKNVLLKFKLNKYKGKQGNNLHNTDLYFGVLFIREKKYIFLNNTSAFRFIIQVNHVHIRDDKTCWLIPFTFQSERLFRAVILFLKWYHRWQDKPTKKWHHNQRFKTILIVSDSVHCWIHLNMSQGSIMSILERRIVFNKILIFRISE